MSHRYDPGPDWGYIGFCVAVFGLAFLIGAGLILGCCWLTL